VRKSESVEKDEETWSNEVVELNVTEKMDYDKLMVGENLHFVLKSEGYFDESFLYPPKIEFVNK